MSTENIYIKIQQQGGELVAKTIHDIGEEAGKTDKKTKGFRKEIDKTSVSLKNTAGAGSLLKTAFGAIGGTLLVREILNASDSLQTMQNKLKVVTDGTEELEQVQSALFDTAKRARTDIGSVVDLYSRMARSTKQLGLSQQETIGLTETISKALQVSGASTQEAQSAVLQLGQALSSGVLRGEEFNAVNEASPVLMQALADSLGIAKGELRKYAEQGKLTSEIVIKAFQEQSGNIQEQFGKMDVTVGQALTNIRTNFFEAFANFDKASGLSTGLANSLNFLANNIDVIIKSAGILGTAFAVNLAGKSLLAVSAVGRLGSAFTILNTVMRANPIFLVVGALGGLYAIVSTLVNQKKELSEATKGEIDNNTKLISSYRTLTEVQKENTKLDLTKKIKEQEEALKSLRLRQQEAEKQEKELQDRIARGGQYSIGFSVSSDVTGFKKLDDELKNAEAKLESYKSTLNSIKDIDKKKVEFELSVKDELAQKQFSDIIKSLEDRAKLANAKIKGDFEQVFALQKGIDLSKLTEQQRVQFKEALKNTQDLESQIKGVKSELNSENKDFLKSFGIDDSNINNAISNLDNLLSKQKELTSEQFNLASATGKLRALQSIGIGKDEAFNLLDRADQQAILNQRTQEYQKIAEATGISVDKLTESLGGATQGNEDFITSIKNFDLSALESIGYTDLLTSSINGFGDSLSDNISQVIQGNKTLSDAFRDMSINVISDLTAMITKMLVFKAISTSLQAFGFGAGSAVSSIAGIGGSFAGGFSTGGAIKGAGSGTSDSILAKVSNGEYIIKADTVKKFGVGFFDNINQGTLPKFSTGGMVTTNNRIINNNQSSSNTVNNSNTNSSNAQNIKVVIVYDRDEMASELANSRGFEARVIDIARANKDEIGA